MTSDKDQKLILVVDDEPDEVSYLTTLLEDNGYSTRSAGDGVQAMNIVKETRPDLITLDISMPEKSGIKFYRELKDASEFMNIPILVVTGITGMGGKAEDFQTFLSSRRQVPPPDGFIAKPIDRDELLDCASKLLA